MRNIIKKIIFILFIIGIPQLIYTENQTYKVGFYEYRPYYYINELGEYDGYYHDFLQVLSKGTGFKFEYEQSTFPENLNKLNKGEIDILFGLHKTEEREKNLLFSNQRINRELYGIYTKENIQYGDLSKLDGYTISLLREDNNSKYILNMLEQENINITPVYSDTHEDAINLFINGDVDAVVTDANSADLRDFNKIFEYSAGDVFIATTKENQVLMDRINKEVDTYKNPENNLIETLYAKYFDEAYKIEARPNKAIILIVIILIITIILLTIGITYPTIRKKYIRKTIKDKINNDKYLLNYQPIVNPKTNKIIGFEGLLRQMDKNSKMLLPHKFIKEIEDNNMTCEISLWALRQAIKDYDNIKETPNIEIDKDNFYISINISVRDIENKEFIKRLVSTLEDKNIKKNKICLEILERIGIQNLDQIQESIQTLREAGFLIAIDDFGVEYNNLDILGKLYFDIIKLDKYFIDGIEYSPMKRDIINFVSKFAIDNKKSIIAEGVEKINQRDIITEIENEKFYVQGYLYSRPVLISDLNKVKLS